MVKLTINWTSQTKGISCWKKWDGVVQDSAPKNKESKLRSMLARWLFLFYLYLHHYENYGTTVNEFWLQNLAKLAILAWKKKRKKKHNVKNQAELFGIFSHYTLWNHQIMGTSLCKACKNRPQLAVLEFSLIVKCLEQINFN